MLRVECAAGCNVTIIGLRFTGGRAGPPLSLSPADAAAAAGNASEAAAACGGYSGGGGCVLVVGGGDSEKGTRLRIEQCAVTNCSARCGGGILVNDAPATLLGGGGMRDGDTEGVREKVTHGKWAYGR